MADSIIIVVGSKNPVKIGATRIGLSTINKEASFIIDSVSVESGVSKQPFGDTETFLGAKTRADSAYEEYNRLHNRKPHYSVGIEGGLCGNDDDPNSIECFAWIVISDGNRIGKSRTASFTLPPVICDHIRNGMELGEADDLVFKRENSKQGSGTVGYLTRGVIDRTSYYEQAVMLAFLPFIRSDLY
eukprot:gene3896-7773_t